VLTEPSEDEKRICQLQNDFAARLRRSQYYIVEPTKTNGEDSMTSTTIRHPHGIQSWSDTRIDIVHPWHLSQFSNGRTLTQRSSHPRFSRTTSTPGGSARVWVSLGSNRCFRLPRTVTKTATKKLNLNDMVDENDEVSSFLSDLHDVAPNHQPGQVRSRGIRQRFTARGRGLRRRRGI